MDKNSFHREDIKYNFLKQIIIRFDFTGMDESELDEVLREVSPALKDKGYVRRTKEISKKMDFDLHDPEKIELEGLFAENIRQQTVYIFHNQSPQVLLKISPTFALISINKSKYVNCLDYCDTLLYVMQIISRKVTFFQCRRFGLRKINQCFIMDINKINEFFEEKHYHLYSYKDSSPKVMNLRDSFLIDNYNVNLIREVVHGEIAGRGAYQVNLDSDIYLWGNDEVSSLIDDKEHVAQMNELLFNLYKDTITLDFLRQLTNGSFDSEVIKGIEKND